MTGSIHRWQFPAGSLDRRAQDAVNDLFARTRPPFVRKGLDQPSALAIIRHACTYAKGMSAATHLQLESIEKVASSSDDLVSDARVAAERLRNVVARLSRHFDAESRIVEDPDFLMLPIMAATGRSDQNAAREIAVGLVSGMKMAELLSIDAGDVRGQVAARRQNPGESEKTSAIGELALAWVDLTGELPGKSKCQAGPFALFVGTLLAEPDKDLSRQINRALDGLKHSAVDFVKNEGYLARWRTGADVAE